MAKAKLFQPDEYLETDEDIAEYITEAMSTADVALMTRALGVIARARGMSAIAKQTGLSRESLYKALSGDGRPQFDTIVRVLKALGLGLRAGVERERTRHATRGEAVATARKSSTRYADHRPKPRSDRDRKSGQRKGH